MNAPAQRDLIEGRMLPAAALEQHVVVLGKTGAGKSSTLRVLVERLLDEGKPVCIIDPKGDWYGLKSSADGTGPGYPVVIFGGEHADIPISAHAGAHVAELVATGNRPCLIDLGGWSVGERTAFFIDFASTLFRTTRGRRWLVIDEVHNFAPQGKVHDVQAGKMLHWANRLASEGRGKGIQMLCASQRPQKVHKDLVTSCETLIAMRVIHPLDRDAVKQWIDGCPDPLTGRQVIGSLASMPRGTGWAWSPEIGFGPERIAFPMFKTYDSFKPQEEHAGRLQGWAEVDLDEVRNKLASVVAEAEANDPAALKERIAELEQQLSDSGTSKEAVDQAYRDGYSTGAMHARGKVLGVVQGHLEQLSQKVTEAASMVTALAVEVADLASHASPAGELPPVPPAPKISSTAEGGARRARPAASEPARGGALEQRILDSLAWWRSAGIRQPTRAQVGFGARAKGKGGHFTNTVSAMKSKGLIEYGPDSTLQLTDAGAALAAPHQRPPARAEMIERARATLKDNAQIRVFDVVAATRDSISREDLASKAGFSIGGYFTNTVSALRSAGLLDYPSNGMVGLGPAFQNLR